MDKLFQYPVSIDNNILWASLLTIFLTACSSHPPIESKVNLAGMYKLFIIENQDSTGAWKEQKWSKGGDGYIVYDGIGHMAVQITPKGYKDFNWPLTEEQTIDADLVKEKIDSMPLSDVKAALAEFASNYVYTGNYRIDSSSNIIEHNRISHTIPAAWNTKVKRKFSFSGDTLILEVLTVSRRLKWIKQK